MKTNLIQAVAAIALTGTIVAEQPLYPPQISTPESTEGTTVTSTAFQGKITALNREAKTVTIEGKDGKSQTLHIGDTTRLSRGDDANVTWDDLKVGFEVRGMVRSQGSLSHAESLTISMQGE